MNNICLWRSQYLIFTFPMCTLFLPEPIEYVPAHITTTNNYEDDGIAWKGCILSSTNQPLNDIQFKMVYYNQHTLQLRGDSASELPFWIDITINLETEVVAVKGRFYAFSQRMHPAAFHLVSSLDTDKDGFWVRITSLTFDWFFLEINIQ